ncbi:telomere zinc finger-associated protein [Amia ocellicauda]|uniref:telomere zinc finger-associated protein n=1 Tax=Amia ocellicauda TaxID=2972642 RepID=UPI003463E9EE
MAAPEGRHALLLLSSLNQQRVQGSFCDASLSAEDGGVFRAHRSVLACFSQLFRDSYAATPFVDVRLPEGCPSEGLGLLLDFIYTGELKLSSGTLDKVRSAALSLSVPDALSLCQEFGQGDPPEAPLQAEPSAADSECQGSPRGAPEGQECTGAAQPSGTAKPKPRQSAKMKSKAVNTTPRPVAPCPATDATTTTRSGRRVKGPSRLLRDSPPPTSPRIPPRRAEPAAKEEGKGASVAADVESAEPPAVGTEDGRGVEAGRDVDHEEEEAGEGEVGREDTDEDYLPPTPPATAANPRSRYRGRARGAVNKENGERPRRDARRGSVQCPTCHKTFLSKYYLKVHNRRHTGEKPFECGKCGKCYYRKENLLEHEARNCMNRAEVVFSCSQCTLTFRRRLELRLHMVSHTGEMPNKCTSCPEQFMQKKDLKSHLIKVHGAPKPHACSLCPKCFLSRTELRLHEASKHRGEKLFVCEECGHRASSRNGLQMHIKAIHRNERPFVCEFCSHAFTQKANLNMHLRTHTGEKPFQCHLCGKTFRTQASLDKHHRTHTGERPFRCEFCEQRFTEKGPLLRHVASKHQEGRPHYCHICSKTFKAIEQLRVHVRRHKGMRKFECSECGYKFTRQAHLRRHSQIHNRVENYNPRQRRLRNLVVEDEKAEVEAGAVLPGEEAVEGEGTLPGDIISVMIPSGTIVVEEVVSTQGCGTRGDEPGFTVADVMEQTLLVTGAYPLHHAAVVTEELVEGGGTVDKA